MDRETADELDSLSADIAARAVEGRPAICRSCRHLRETTCEPGRKHYMACGFPLPTDVPAWLRNAYAVSDTEAQRLLTRYQLDVGGIPAECGGFALIPLPSPADPPHI